MIQFVVTCAKAKRGRVSAPLRLGSVNRRHAAAAAEVWIRRLCESTDTAVPASELYRGDHWKAATEAAEVALAAGGGAWVVSAGYGLVSFAAPLRPYSATFTPSDPDSVSRLIAPDGDAIQTAWWAALAEWEGPAPGAPRLLVELAGRAPADLLVVAVSEVYLRALTSDLLAARERLTALDRLLVLCGGAPAEHPLADNLIRWDTRAQVVPGALTSMNARVARRLLHEIRPARLTLSAARELVAAWANTAPSRARPERLRVSDEEIREFIRDRITAAPGISASALHRAFRDSGLACERLRFLALLHAVSAEFGAGG